MPKPIYNVLIVDDERSIIASIEEVLGNIGVNCIGAKTLNEAREVIEKNPPHLVLLDIALGEELGLTLLEEISRGALLLHAPIAIMTGYPSETNVSKALALGAADCIVKPFSNSILIRKVLRLLKSNNFLSYRFEPEKLPRIRLDFSGQLVKMNEATLELRSNVKIAPDTRIWISSPLLKKLGLNSTMIKSDRVRSGTMVGEYTFFASFVGITAFLVQCVRDEIKTWKN